MHRKGRCVFPTGEQHGQAKLSWARVNEIRDIHSSGVSIYALAKRFGVTWTTVKNVVIGKTWKQDRKIIYP
jgi:lambda repressor-like predicted transcriptional regulator